MSHEACACCGHKADKMYLHCGRCTEVGEPWQGLDAVLKDDVVTLTCRACGLYVVRLPFRPVGDTETMALPKVSA